MSRNFTWPHAKRTAVVVSILLESWSEGKAPSYFPRTTPLAPGLTDHAGISWSRFGGNEGIWRLLRMLEGLGLPATLFCNGRGAELFPDAVAAFAGAGHDVAAHGYLQDETMFSLGPVGERAAIAKTLDILEYVSGRRPRGWLTPIYGWSQGTIDYLIEAGLTWSCDALDTSIPHQHTAASGRIVLLPWSDFVDNRVLRAPPQTYFDVHAETFEYLHAHEPGALLNLGIHCHFGGRPLMAAVVRRTLEYLARQPDVWFARHDEVAGWLTDCEVGAMSYRGRFFEGG